MNDLRQLRWNALLEGSSLLCLLFVAMPIKYLLHEPRVVRVVGSIHGLLFLLFSTALYRSANERAWPARKAYAAFVAAFIPGGTFVLDRSLKRELGELANGS